MAHDVFISYASPDKLSADAACAKIESAHVRCWIAPRDVRPGADYAEQILTAIEHSRVMVLIFSQHANDSSHVRREVERAVSKGLSILTVRIEDVTPARSMEYYLSETHWLDAITRPFERHIEHVVKCVLLALEGIDAHSTLSNRRSLLSKLTEGLQQSPREAARLVRLAFGLCGDRDRLNFRRFMLTLTVLFVLATFLIWKAPLFFDKRNRTLTVDPVSQHLTNGSWRVSVVQPTKLPLPEPKRSNQSLELNLNLFPAYNGFVRDSVWTFFGDNHIKMGQLAGDWQYNRGGLLDSKFRDYKWSVDGLNLMLNDEDLPVTRTFTVDFSGDELLLSSSTDPGASFVELKRIPRVRIRSAGDAENFAVFAAIAASNLAAVAVARMRRSKSRFRAFIKGWLLALVFAPVFGFIGAFLVAEDRMLASRTSIILLLPVVIFLCSIVTGLVAALIGAFVTTRISPAHTLANPLIRS